MNAGWKAAHELQVALVAAASYLDGALAADQGVTVQCQPPPHYFPAKLLFHDDDVVAQLERTERFVAAHAAGWHARAAARAAGSRLAAATRQALELGRPLAASRQALESRDGVARFASGLSGVVAALAALLSALEEEQSV